MTRVPAGAGARAPAPAAVLLAVPAALLLAGCSGAASDPAGSGSTTPAVRPVVVPVEMQARAFSPASFSFAQGSVVVFRFHNGTAERHRAVVGDAIFQQDRVDGQLDPGDPLVNTVLVDPGATADLPYRMDVPGTLLIGCHEAGHWEAGMRATITVTPPA